MGCCEGREKEDDLPGELVAAIREQRCVIVVGPSFAQAEGLPLRRGVLESVASRRNTKARVDSDLATRSEILHVQSRVVNELGRTSAAREFAEELEVNGVTRDMRRRLDVLHALPFAFVVTQCWDNLLEEHADYREVTPTGANDYSEFMDVLRAIPSQDRQRTVLKFEGDIRKMQRSSSFASSQGPPPVNDAEHFSWALLTDEDRTRVMNDDKPNGGKAFWHELLATKTVIFVGCDVREGYLAKFTSGVAAKGKMRNAYMASEPLDDKARTFLKGQYGVQVLQCAGDGYDEPIDVFMKRLLSAVKPRLR